MKNIKVGTIKPRKLTVSDKKVWSKYMTHEYVYISNDCEYVYLRFEGYDHMEQEWRIVKIAEVKKIRKNLDARLAEERAELEKRSMSK